jgi:hypothetical protein
MAYLNPASPPKPKEERRLRRVVDRDDLQILIPLRERPNG